MLMQTERATTQDESTATLCPELYRILRHRFGEVNISNQGESVVFGGAYVHGDRGVTRRQIIDFGETYRIRCPFCRDTRARLWIPHVYGQPDPGRSDRNTNYGVCFNEDCLKKHENRRRLADMIFGLTNVGYRHMTILPGTREDVRLGPKIPPGEVIPLTDLPSTHEAVRYMTQGRRYSLPLLHYYGVGYCVAADPRFPEFRPAAGRVIIPIWMNGMYAGWQGRFIGEPPHKVPKYFSCPGMPKRQILYNYDRAMHKPFVVIVEGVTDVWGVGDHAVAVLGKRISPQQQQLLQQTWAGKPIVLMLDPEAQEDMQLAVRRLTESHRGPIITVQLPDGYDPGNYDPETSMRIIYARAASIGVQLQLG